MDDEVRCFADLSVGEQQSIMDIAMTKAWNYSMDYDPVSGREVEKTGYLYLKEGYIEGFLAGVTHRFEQTDKECRNVSP